MSNSGTLTQIKQQLQQEEALLKSIKSKLVDQLQRLKVEELALVNYLSTGNFSNNSQMNCSTGSYFNTMSKNVLEEECQVNNTLPIDLSHSNTLISCHQSGVDEEIDEDD